MSSLATVIEFFGLPGSGKTTITNKLVRHLRDAGIEVLTRSHALADERPVVVRHFLRARYVVASAIRTPRPFLLALRLIREDGQQSLHATLKVCWNMWCVLGWYGWLSRHHKGPVIADQGLAQAVCSIRLSAVHPRADWHDFLHEFGMIEAVVITECDPSLLEARLSARKGQNSRLSGIPRGDRHWQVAQRGFALGCDEIEALFPTLRVRNETSGDPEQLVAEIAQWLGSAHSAVRMD